MAAPLETADRSADAAPASGPHRRRSRPTPTRISSLYVGLITAAVLLVLLVVFLIQNARTVEISFVGAHLHVSLAVAMLSAAVAGALITGVAGTARIGQLRRSRRTSVAPADSAPDTRQRT